MPSEMSGRAASYQAILTSAAMLVVVDVNELAAEIETASQRIAVPTKPA